MPKEKNNCSGCFKHYDYVSELKPLLMLTPEEEKNPQSYEEATREEQLKFWKPIYKAHFLALSSRKLKRR